MTFTPTRIELCEGSIFHVLPSFISCLNKFAPSNETERKNAARYGLSLSVKDVARTYCSFNSRLSNILLLLLSTLPFLFGINIENINEQKQTIWMKIHWIIDIG
jgi:hypothetical protein